MDGKNCNDQQRPVGCAAVTATDTGIKATFHIIYDIHIFKNSFRRNFHVYYRIFSCQNTNIFYLNKIHSWTNLSTASHYIIVLRTACILDSFGILHNGYATE